MLSIGSENCDAEGFEILAPTTRRNALRVLRAMQLPKPGNCSLLVPLPNVLFVFSFLFKFFVFNNLNWLMHSSSIRR